MFRRQKNIDNDELVRWAEDNLRKGSAEAFHFLYQKYNKKIYRFCLRMLDDQDAARDAFQETFIKVFEHRKDFRGKNFNAWLFTIARRTCLNQIRARKEHESYDEFIHIPAKTSETDVAMKDYIDKSISVLPFALKEALLLREYEECSYQEIAEILNIDLSLAKVRVFRAREILRKLLAPLKKELYES